MYWLVFEVSGTEIRWDWILSKASTTVYGLIIGEFGIVGLWMIIGMFTGVNYQGALPG